MHHLVWPRGRAAGGSTSRGFTQPDPPELCRLEALGSTTATRDEQPHDVTGLEGVNRRNASLNRLWQTGLLAEASPGVGEAGLKHDVPIEATEVALDHDERLIAKAKVQTGDAVVEGFNQGVAAAAMDGFGFEFSQHFASDSLAAMLWSDPEIVDEQALALSSSRAPSDDARSFADETGDRRCVAISQLVSNVREDTIGEDGQVFRLSVAFQ